MVYGAKSLKMAYHRPSSSVECPTSTPEDSDTGGRRGCIQTFESEFESTWTGSCHGLGRGDFHEQAVAIADFAGEA